MAIVTQDTVEQAVCEYVMSGRMPRFVLMDKECYENFNKQFISKQKFLDINGEEIIVTPESPKLSVMHSQTGYAVKFLVVETIDHLFEVVG